MNRAEESDPVRRILIVEKEVVPTWWLHLIDHFIAAIRGMGEVPVVYVLKERKKSGLSSKWGIVLLINLSPLLVEWSLFGLRIGAFRKKYLRSHLVENGVEGIFIDHVAEVENTDLHYLLSDAAGNAAGLHQKTIWLNQGLGKLGIQGCLQFMFHYMIQRHPYQICFFSERGIQVVYEHIFQTINHSLLKNMNYWLWALSTGVRKVCATDLVVVNSNVISFKAVSYFWWGKSIYNRLLWKVLPKWFSPFYIKKWGVLLQKKSSENQIFQSNHRYQIAFPDHTNGWADPFLIRHKDQHYLFLEELNEDQQKGILVVAHLDQDGVFQRIVPILSEPFHLSYPFVFEKEGQWFMIPESAQGRSIRLYQAHNFPDEWCYVKDLMVDVQAYDTTPFYHNGKWWIFTVLKKGDGASSFDQLYLYHAADIIQEEWIPHPLNPVVTDSRSARPAGKVFSKNGKLYRPSQNCLERYGHKLLINEITHLSETQYEERIVEHVFLSNRSDVAGIHTFNANDGMLVVDALFRTWSFNKNKAYKKQMVKAKIKDS